jgi:hypothetical protein
MPEALVNVHGEAVVVATKQQQFAMALCRHVGLSDRALPHANIYGLGDYKKKADVIVDHMAAEGYAPHQTLFFEDLWPTLAKCLTNHRLNGVHLHLCGRGYVTD